MPDAKRMLAEAHRARKPEKSKIGQWVQGLDPKRRADFDDLIAAWMEMRPEISVPCLLDALRSEFGSDGWPSVRYGALTNWLRREHGL